jgi:hypothetical protein
MTFGACACGASDAVDVIFGLHRHIEIDDEVDAFYVDAARGDIGRDQDAVLAGLEAIERLATLIERAIAVYLGGGVSHARHLVAQALGTELHARKDDSAAGVLLEKTLQERDFLPLRDDEKFLRDAIGGRARRRDLDLHGHLHVVGGELTDLAAQRRREEARLALFRNRFDDLADLWPETHIEHAIGLVDDEVIDGVETDSALVEVVDEAARCRDDDRGAAMQCIDLRTHTSSTDEDGGLDAQWAADLTHSLIDLEREFARRSQHERKCAASERVLHHRDTEGERLAGAGLGDTDDILALHTSRDRLALDGRRNSQPERVERLEDGWCDSERVKCGLTALRVVLWHLPGNYITFRKEINTLALAGCF